MVSSGAEVGSGGLVAAGAWVGAAGAWVFAAGEAHAARSRAISKVADNQRKVVDFIIFFSLDIFIISRQVKHIFFVDVFP